jgi:thiol-disulfide isomerase/thioredoxin
MRISVKSFLIGLGAGIAATMLALNVWGRYYAGQYFANLQVPIAATFVRQHLEAQAKSVAAHLPDPWMPESSGTQHDNWAIGTLDGKTVKLGGFKGKVVFLDFWATWCAPCIAEMPSIEKLAKSLKGENIAFVLVANDKKQAVESYVRENHLDLSSYLMAGDSPADLPSHGVPATYILDRKGAAVLSHFGAANWDTDNVRSYLRDLETH